MNARLRKNNKILPIPAWCRSARIYQIFPDRFARSHSAGVSLNLENWGKPPSVYGFKGGDLAGIRDKLDYIQGLGFNTLYLTPVFLSAANHRYHTIDYFQTDPLLGGDKELCRLIHELHRRKMRIILDGVFNHTGRAFAPFASLVENGEASPYIDWFKVHSFPLFAYNEVKEPGYDCWMGLRELPKLNTANPQVREYIFSIAEHWIDQGIDGWRLDAAEQIDDHGFWKEFRKRVKARNPEVLLLGEIWDEASAWLRGDEFDGVMNYPILKSLLEFLGSAEQLQAYGPYHLKRGGVESFVKDINELLSCYSPQALQASLNLLGSHDTPRIFTMLGENEELLRAALLIMYSLPGMPCMYYGDELLYTGGADPECRASMNWNLAENSKKRVPSLISQLSEIRSGSVYEEGHCSLELLGTGAIRINRIGERSFGCCIFNGSKEACTFSLESPQEKAATETPESAGSWLSSRGELIHADMSRLITIQPGEACMLIPQGH